ncbi:MAG: acyl-CoA dehydrogenase family protein [Nitrososphaerota archaeon]|nr:acyl-CoA dehydrogenase family protein [Nitrososphaerota archaeon]
MPFFVDEQRKIVSMLYPSHSSEYNELLESFGEFVQREIVPTARQVDKSGVFPKENVQKILRHGFTNIPYPENLGGLGLPYPIYVAAMELVGKACASTAISLAIHGTVCDGIYQFGNSSQHKDHLRALINGEKLGAFALTEPGAGSDARSIITSAESKSDGWHINGEKMYITNSGVADYYLVFAKTKNGHAAIIVPKETSGFSPGSNIPKMGLKGSTLSALHFENVLVPLENLVGRNGDGFEYAKRMLFSGRVTVAAISVGIAQMALEKSITYAKQRSAFGQRVSDFQMTRSKLAEMATEINAARLMTYYAGNLKERKLDYSVGAAEAKLFSTEMALRVCNEAIQIHGGYGYTDEADVHRHWRDAKLMTIGEGTSEIMKIIIANSLLGEGDA